MYLKNNFILQNFIIVWNRININILILKKKSRGEISKKKHFMHFSSAPFFTIKNLMSTLFKAIIKFCSIKSLFKYLKKRYPTNIINNCNSVIHLRSKLRSLRLSKYFLECYLSPSCSFIYWP